MGLNRVGWVGVGWVKRCAGCEMRDSRNGKEQWRKRRRRWETGGGGGRRGARGKSECRTASGKLQRDPDCELRRSPCSCAQRRVVRAMRGGLCACRVRRDGHRTSVHMGRGSRFRIVREISPIGANSLGGTATLSDCGQGHTGPHWTGLVGTGSLQVVGRWRGGGGEVRFGWQVRIVRRIRVRTR